MSCNNSTRYDIGDDGMKYRHQDGDFVLFTDHQEEIAALKKELDALKETYGRDGAYLKCRATEDDEKNECVEYRGKTVWAWWAKAHAYGVMVHGISPILGAGEGEHTADAARRVVAERDALKKELDNLRQQLTNMTYSNTSHREMAETWRAAAVERGELKKELANEKDAHELCHGLRLALAKDLEIARAERNRAIFEPRRELESAKWRKRSEREPEDNEPVMWCRVPVCEPYVVTCMCSDDWDESFTHWMPLPEGPKG